LLNAKRITGISYLTCNGEQPGLTFYRLFEKVDFKATLIVN
jgi:hypothetical protein